MRLFFSKNSQYLANRKREGAGVGWKDEYNTVTHTSKMLKMIELKLLQKMMIIFKTTTK
jgi:hypothetical protein